VLVHQGVVVLADIVKNLLVPRQQLIHTQLAQQERQGLVELRVALAVLV